MALFSCLRAGIARLVRERRGNVMMIMGFALVPLTFATGMAVDYSRAARLQTKLNAAADAASLSTVTKPMMDQSMAAACNAARRTFLNALQQNAGGLNFDVNTAGNLKIAITETYSASADVTYTCINGMEAIPSTIKLAKSRTTTVTYAGSSTNAFGSVLGSPTIAVGGTGTARASLSLFIDIHVALDTSQSMGLAATDADALALWNVTKTQSDAPCTFGCHATTGTYPAGKPLKPNDQLARENGINLRIDVLRNATSDMIQTAIDEQGSLQLYRFALYRIGKTTTDITALTTDLAGTKNTVSTLTLGNSDSSGPGDTNLPDMTTYILPKITAKGDGSTQQKAKAYLFIVTDGSADTYGSCTYNHCTAPIDPTTCDAYKNAGVTVGVVYTTYFPIKNDPTVANSTALDFRYNDLVKTFSLKDKNNAKQYATQIAPNLQACASDGWYFEASDGPSIHAAIQKLFRQASQSATLTR